MCVHPKFIPVSVLNIQITTSEYIPPYRREVVVSGDGNCLNLAVALWKDYISDKKTRGNP